MSRPTRCACRTFSRLALLALSLAFLATPAQAVSLGDEIILSLLGDPVEVEIEVLQWEDMDLERVQISAATREEYEVFDLTWLPVLEDLNFNLVGPDLNGRVRVLISSRSPLDEPFLELLLVLRWPGGSLRREYVLLFDPPGRALSARTAPGTIAEPIVAEPVTPAPQLAAPPEPAPALATTPEESLGLSEPAPVPTETVTLAPEPEPAAPALVDLQAEAPGALTPAPRRVPPSVPPRVPEAEAEEATADETVVEEAVVEEALVEEAVTEEAVAEEAVVEEAVVEEAVAEETVVEEALAEEAVEPDSSVEQEIPDARTQLAIDVETLAPQVAALPATSRRTYQVRSGDSLWNIARQFRPAGAGENLYQMLLSIHDLNRNAFVNNNISLLKANAVLQIPDAVDIAAIAPLTAQAEFDRRWELGTERFAAVQRGEAIPLFAPPPEEIVLDVEEELPPGAEAPPVEAAADSLIMVSEANVPQPLQLGVAADADAAPEAEPDTTAALLPEPQVPALPAPAVADAPAAEQVSTPAPEPSPQVTAAGQSTVRVVSREAFAAELETELTAMRTRRQTAEALAAQLQASLAQAQAERAAQASLFGRENLILAGISAALLGALLAAAVFTLKLAGDLRMSRRDIPLALDTREQPGWLSAKAGETMERREPRMPEVQAATSPGGSRKVAAPTATAVPNDEPEDLFARMEDMLDSGAQPARKS